MAGYQGIKGQRGVLSLTVMAGGESRVRVRAGQADGDGGHRRGHDQDPPDQCLVRQDSGPLCGKRLLLHCVGVLQRQHRAELRDEAEEGRHEIKGEPD